MVANIAEIPQGQEPNETLDLEQGPDSYSDSYRSVDAKKLR